MRILNLDLIAFGPFANQSLDLSDGRFGLHLVYGSNEAGKSSTLRALRQVLYGIDVQTEDDFRFPYKKLKLGATLEHHDGKVLSFIRLKKNKNPLRTSDEKETLSDDCLESFLGHVDSGMFQRQFGLDWTKLVEGGQEMVRSEGELSRILFAAGSGLTALGQVQDAIESEMRDLFLPTGSKPIINDLIEKHKALEDQLRQVRLSSQEWRRHAEAVETARQKQTELKARKNELNREHNRLGRIHRAKRSIQKLRDVERELSSLKNAKLLPPGFTERRLNVREQLLKSQQAQTTFHTDLKRLTEQQQNTAVNQTVLDQAEEIESLNQEIEKYKSSVQDLPLRNGERESAENEARRLLRDLRPKHPWDAVEELRVSEADRTLIRELAPDQKVLTSNVETAHAKLQDTRLHLDDLLAQQQHQTEVPDLSHLKSTLKRVTARGSLEAEREDKRRAIHEIEQTVQQECERLAFWSGTLE
ncbi:MAG: AAA family ATPase, partial [Planctomycetaceae bacterium]|nr:AAA family ATPase [Planctomycetaceae bacterium]